MCPTGNSRTLWWILVGAFVLRLGFAMAWQARMPADAPFYFGDSETYWELGRTIAAGEPYQFESPERKAFRTPGYPLLLSPTFLVGGDNVSPIWGRVISALFGTVAVAAVWWLARTVWDDRTAIGAAAIACCYPGAIATSGFVLAEAPFAAAMIGQLSLWQISNQCMTRKSSVSWAFLAGLAAGGATLLRPSWLLFTPAVGLLYCLCHGTRPLRSCCLNLAVMLFGLGIVMAPWWIRNAVVFSRFVPTTLQVGASLYDGLSPQADGSSNMEPVDQYTERFRAQGGIGKGPPDLGRVPIEYQLDVALRESATTWASENLGDAASLAVVKFRRLWNIWPNEPSMRSWYVRIGVACSFVPVMLLAGWSVWRWRHRGWALWLCVLPAVYFTLLHVVFVSSIRYRQPAMLALMVLAAGAFQRRQETPRNPDATTPLNS